MCTRPQGMADRTPESGSTLVELCASSLPGVEPYARKARAVNEGGASSPRTPQVAHC